MNSGAGILTTKQTTQLERRSNFIPSCLAADRGRATFAKLSLSASKTINDLKTALPDIKKNAREKNGFKGKSCAGIVTVGFDCFEVGFNCFEVGFNCFEVGFDGGLNDGVNVLDRKRKTLVVFAQHCISHSYFNIISNLFKNLTQNGNEKTRLGTLRVLRDAASSVAIPDGHVALGALYPADDLSTAYHLHGTPTGKNEDGTGKDKDGTVGVRFPRDRGHFRQVAGGRAKGKISLAGDRFGANFRGVMGGRGCPGVARTPPPL